MKVIEAIERLDSQHPNAYSKDDKVTWLSQVDARIKRKIIDTHEGPVPISVIPDGDEGWKPYKHDQNDSTILLAPEPWDAMYLYYMEAMIAYNDKEYEDYNNAMSLYDHEYNAFAGDYNKNHMPKACPVRYF